MCFVGAGGGIESVEDMDNFLHLCFYNYDDGNVIMARHKQSTYRTQGVLPPNRKNLLTI